MPTLSERINDDDFEEIGTIDAGNSLDTTECQSDGCGDEDVAVRNLTGTGWPSSISINTDERTTEKPMPNCSNIEESNTTSQLNQANQKRRRVKSLSYNGATLQKLQLKRMELRALPLISPSGNNIDSFFRAPVSPVATDRKELATTTTLPIVGNATKQKILQLNQRYAPSASHYRNSSYNQSSQTSTGGLETKNGSNQPSPFKLMHGIGSNNTNCATNLITPDNTQLRYTNGEGGTKDDHYLFQYTHLACGSTSKSKDTIVDDEASFSSSYDSPTPHLHAELICNSGVNGDNNCIDESQQNLDNNDAQKCRTLLHNRRLRNFMNFAKQAIIILGIALFCACLDVAKDKILHWLHIIMQQIFSLVFTRAESFLASFSSASAWLQSAQGKIMTLHQHFMCRIMSSVYVWKDLVQNRVMHRIAIWREFSLWEKYRMDYSHLSLPSKFLGKTKQLTEVFVRGFGGIRSNWYEDVDFTSVLLNAWFRIRKLQLDCGLFVKDAMQGMKEMRDIASTTWNSTVVFVSAEWYAFMSKAPSQTSSRELIILEKSTVTNPIPLLNILPNQTLSPRIPMENGVIRSKSIITKPSFLLRAPQYLHRSGHLKGAGLLSNNFSSETNEHRQIHSGYLPSTIKAHAHKPSPEEHVRQHYQTSFPTFLTNMDKNDEDNGFESVNLMDMATELTKYLILRRRHD